MRMQLVCYHWYAKTIPESIQIVSLPKEKIAQILRSKPFGSSIDYIDLWSKVRPLTVKMLADHWKMVEKKQPLFGSGNEIAEWQVEERKFDNGKTLVGARHAPLFFKGFRSKQTGEVVGIARSFSKISLSEGTFKDGKKHGLQRYFD